MPFDPNVVRKSSGVTLDIVHQRVAAAIQGCGLFDPTQVWLVIDDEVAPTEVALKDIFVTVRLPSLIWEHGDVMIGGGNLSEFIVQGQIRVSLWMRNELDLYSHATDIAAQALAEAPRGTKLLGKLVKLFWEEDILNEDGESILKRPLLFVSMEPPADNKTGLRPWRLVWQLEFDWDVTAE